MKLSYIIRAIAGDNKAVTIGNNDLCRWATEVAKLEADLDKLKIDNAILEANWDGAIRRTLVEHLHKTTAPMLHRFR